MKTRLLILATLFSVIANTYAQNMSDDQVLKYVSAETAKGTSQQAIGKELLMKGVTLQQLQRVKRKAEAIDKQQGKVSGSRLRNSKKEDKQTNRNFDGTISTNVVDPSEQINSVGLYVSDPSDSLEFYMKKMQEGERVVYGRNIFNKENLTFQPASNMATPQNYRLGAGDVVNIDIWGATQLSVSETISPDGIIVLEGVGPINLGGKSISQAKSTLSAKLSQYYSDCKYDLTLGETRTIQVQVVGEVNTPGTYSMNSLSSAFNALYAAGGINNIGTLRNIKIYRNGKHIASIDVYEYLVNGNTAGDVRLQDNDLIVVGAYDCLVKIEGKVKRPLWYEMKKTESIKNLIDYCGGFTGDAYKDKIRIIRKSGQEYSIHTLGEFEIGDFALNDEDLIQIDSVRPRFSNMVEVRGAAVHPGKYELSSKISSVKELLLTAEGLREDAYIERAVMHREKEDLSLEMVSIDLNGIVNGTAADVPLKKNDVLFIPSKKEMMGYRTLSILGEVHYPGTYPFAENSEIRDLIIQAGGFTDGASLAKIDVLRRVRDAKAVVDDGTISECFTFSLDEYYNIQEDTVFVLKPYDQIIVRKSPAYTEQRTVEVKGEANFTGIYSLTRGDFRLSDLIKSCGGLTERGNVSGAHLTRRMTSDEISKRDEANRKAQIALYEYAIREGNDLNMAIADSLLSMKMNSDYTYSVAIELKKAVEQPGSIYDLILRSGDVLEIPEYNNTIKVSGEVMYPVSMAYEQGKNLNYYIKHAGGYSAEAGKSRVYGIHQNGSVVKLSSNSVKDIQPGTEIIVPAKKARKRMSTGEVMSMASAGTSLASVIIALMNIIRK